MVIKILFSKFSNFISMEYDKMRLVEDEFDFSLLNERKKMKILRERFYYSFVD